ncbi:MAG: PD-(D/E)XK nuclease domain-containing protein [Deltaproteobacteria bacterium]|nr:PD-(D/E)XK nuclease domain-containing protein [Deltaproteobacteria bacterium]
MVLYRLLAGISYTDHLDALRSPVVRILQKIIQKFTGQDSSAAPLQEQSSALADFLVKSKGESYYRSLFQACFWMAGAKVTPEKQENLERLDPEVFFAPLTYVFELKMLENARGANTAIRKGMLQIRQRGYGLASKYPVFVSIAIGKAERNIVGCIFEKDGQETVIDVEAIHITRLIKCRNFGNQPMDVKILKPTIYGMSSP